MSFTLITGRTAAQGQSLHKGKESEAYHRATALVEMNADDMARLGIEEEQTVRVHTVSGQVELPAYSADLPAGMLFIPMGPTANLIIGTDTESTGMPPYKGLTAEVEPV